MKKTKTYALFLTLCFCNIIIAQVGIGTVNPDSSSILEISSNSKGILLPRLTISERDAIANPANGLLIYNETTSNFNYYNSEWKDFSPSYKSVNSTSTISSNSTTDINIVGMTLSPFGGKYSVSFESQISNTEMPVPNYVNSNMLLADFTNLYNQIVAVSPIDTHAPAYGGGETISPGRYDVASAISIGGNLKLDGLGNPNSIFIFHSGGAINFAANTTIILMNGASQENIFWVGEGAVGVGADSIIYGNLVSHGAAISVGANTNVYGRLLTNSGAVAFGPGNCSAPINESLLFNLGTLESFVIFTGSGVISNTGVSVYNGNICTGAGATSSLSAATVNGIIVPPNVNTNISGNEVEACTATFGVYENDVLILSSSKQITCSVGFTNISLSAIANITNGQSITVKWKLNNGTLSLGNRVLTAVKVQ